LLEEIDGEPLIFLPHLRRAEEGIALRVKIAHRINRMPPTFPISVVDFCSNKIGDYCKSFGIRAAESPALPTHNPLSTLDPASLPRFAAFHSTGVLSYLAISATSTSPVALLTVATPHAVGLTLASNVQPNSPSDFAPHLPSSTSTTYQPEPGGFPAWLPFA
jgi:hypothetical protein